MANCKVCKTPMVVGVALSYDYRRVEAWRFGPMVLWRQGSHGSLSECLKCPSCGHSKFK